MDILSKREDGFALAWAKKFKAVNILGGKCTECGNDNIFVLDFHHVNGKDKEFTLSQIRYFRWSLIEREINKCILLCSNCHRERHYNNSANAKAKRKFLFSQNITQCSKCEYSGKNFASLDFHHVGDKKFGINSALTSKIKVSVQELLDEVERCIVLCSNCHRMEHFDSEKFDRLKPYINYKMKHHKELSPALDKEKVYDMYFDQGMRQVDIVRHFECAKGTISGIIKKMKQSD